MYPPRSPIYVGANHPVCGQDEKPVGHVHDRADIPMLDQNRREQGGAGGGADATRQAQQDGHGGQFRGGGDDGDRDLERRSGDLAEDADGEDQDEERSNPGAHIAGNSETDDCLSGKAERKSHTPGYRIGHGSAPQSEGERARAPLALSSDTSICDPPIRARCTMAA